MRRRARHTAATVFAAALTLILTCGFTVLPTARLSTAGLPTARGAQSDQPLRVVITMLTPVSIGPTDTITIAGTVTNTTAEPIDHLSTIVGVGPRIDSRGSLTRDLAKTPGLSHILGIATSHAPTSLAPGGQAPFTLTIPVRGTVLESARPTVYPLQVRFDSAERTDLGEANTFLPYFPNSVSDPLRIAWVWPLDAPPALSAGGEIFAPNVPATFAAGGRLRRILDLARAPTGASGSAAAYAPVTFAVNPTLVTMISTVARDGWTRTGDKPPENGRSASTAAVDWLNGLRAQTRGATVVALPYADPDAVALVRAGLGADLGNAIALGRAELTKALPAAQLATIAWPVNGAIDQATLDAYAAAGATAVIVSSNQLPTSPRAELNTQSAPVSLATRGPDVRGLAADAEATSLLAGNGRDASSPRMAAQRLLALLAVAVGEQPNGTAVRDMVLTMPRDFDPNSAWARDLLHDTAALPWLHPVALDTVVTDPVGNRSGLQPYPSSARGKELAQSTLTGAGRSVATLRQEVADARAMLPDRTLTRPLDDALTRAESAEWRGRNAVDGQRTLLDEVATDADALLGGVSVAATGQVTLTSRNGDVPVTVRNTLPEPVSVDINLSAADRTKLTSSGPRRYVIPAGAKQRVLLPADTQRAGTFRVSLTVTTPTGRQIAAAPLTVHSTAYGTITLVITLAALGILVLALGRRIFLRLRHWRGRPPGPSAAT